MNLIIPMAGEGSRFREKGFSLPKPLIDVEGKTMIRRVYESLGDHEFSKEIFICSKEHESLYNISNVIRSFCPKAIVVFLEEKTQGAACTVLKGIPYCNLDEPLLIVNSDQLVELSKFNLSYKSNMLITFDCPEKDPKWSYCLVENGHVVEVVEKVAVSEIANTGAYIFESANLFEQCAIKMIAQRAKHNGEYYIAPIYNEIINLGRPVWNSNAKLFVGLGTPEDLEKYLSR